MYKDAQKIVVDDSPALFVYEKNYRLPMSDKLKGFVFNGIYIETIDFYAVHKE
jgi:peptide/nickel transport system substrate-binding protein